MAVDANIGTAWISVVPDTSKLTEAIKEALKDTEKSIPKSGSTIGQGLTSGINKTLKAGIAGAGLAAGGVLAASITKGLGRLSGIDNAQAKLSGLGHEAKAVEGIMDDALASVKGTAFGLEDAATIAASAVAAGIGPGKDLQRTLKLTGDAATIAGTDLSTMGSIVNKVATSDMMQMDVANQMMDAGIPILQMVGEELGVTAEEARKMASEGKISFETFQSALEDGLGGAALKSGDTVQGAFANMQAAAGRFGAQLAAPVFSAAPEIFGAMGGAFDQLGEKLEPLIEDFADWLAPRMEAFATETIPKLVDGVMGAVDAFIEFGGWVKDNAAWIKPLAAGIGGAVAAIYAWNTATTIAKGVQIAFNAVLAVNPIMLIVTALAAVTAGLVYFFTQTETGREAWSKFTTALSDGWQWVQDKVGGGVDWLTEKFTAFTDWLSTAWSGIRDLFGKGDYTGALSDAFGIEEDSAIIGFFFDVREAATRTIEWVKGFFTDVKDLAGGVADILFKGDYTGLPFGLGEDSRIVDFLFTVRESVMAVADGFMAAWEKIKTGDIVGAIASAFSGVKEAAGIAWDFLIDYVKDSWANLKLSGAELWDGVKASAADAWDSIKADIAAKWDSTVDYVTTNFTWDNIKSSAVGMWDSVVSGAESAWAQVKTTASETWSTVKSGASDIWEGAKTGASDMWASVKAGASTVWDETKRIAGVNWQSIKDLASEGWGPVWEKVTSGASGVWENVTTKVSEVTGKLREKAREAFDWAKDDTIMSGPIKAVTGVFDGIKGQWDELMPKLQPIKDAATDLWGVLTGKASEASGEARTGLAGMIDKFTENAEKLQEKIQPIKDAAADLWGTLTGKAQEASGEAREGIAGMIDDFNTKVGELQEKIQPAKDAIKQIWDSLHGRGGETQEAGAEEGGGIAGMVESITENIRKFRDEAQPIIDKFKAKWDELKTAMEPLLDSVKDKLGKVAKIIGGATLAIALGLLLSPFILLAGAIYGALVAANAIADGFAWVSEKWAEMKDSVETKWNELKANVFDAWERAVAWLQTRWSEVTASVSGAWTSLKDSVVSTWNTIKSSVFDAWESSVAWLQTRWNEITTSVSGAWTSLKDSLVGVWNTIKSSVFDAWDTAVNFLKDTFNTIATTISDKWTWLKDQLSNVWSWIKENVFDAMGRGLDTLKSWFQDGVDGIAKIWDGLKAAAAKPARFVVDTVWNNGILAAWNTISDFLPGIAAKDKIPLGNLGGYASGGVLPGYTPGRDVHEFHSPTGGRIHLSGGEAIMRPEWTRAVGGPGAVERMNRDAKTGKLRNASGHGPSGLWDLGEFAGGGVIGAMMNIVRAKYGNILTMTSGQRPGGGMHGAGLATDWSNGSGNTPAQLALAHDIAQTYPGSAELIYDSPGWAGNIKNGQNVGPFGQFYTMAQAGRHDHHVHWGMTTPPTMQFGGGVFEGGSNGGGIGAAIFNWIADKARSIWSSVVDPIKDKIGGKAKDWEGSSFGEIPGAMFTSLADAAWSRLSSLFGSGGGSDSGSVDTSNVPGDVVGAVETVFARHGFTGAEWEAAKWIIQKESGWSPTAQNPSSGAYGLFQFNPMGGNTLGAYLPDRNTDPAVQADAGARYIKDRYGTPSAAKRFWEQNQWYANGGVIPSGMGLFDTGGVWKSGTMGMNLSGKNEYVFTNRAMRDFQQATESLQVVAEEISAAFNGGDWGMGELASYVGIDLAESIINGAAALGEISRTIGEQAQKSGTDYATTQATGALDVMGLGGLVPLGQKLGAKAWDLYQASPYEVGFNGQSVTVEIEAESDADLIRVAEFKRLADQVHGLDVKVNKRPSAASITRGGVM